MGAVSKGLTMVVMFFSICLCENYEIIKNEPIWLGENTTLRVEIPNLRKPVVWKTENYKYECDLTCTNTTKYKVTYSRNESTLFIGSVAWKYSAWSFEDDDLKLAKTTLNISVKPSIEIKNTSSVYVIRANCSLPQTSIACFLGEKPLEFSNKTESPCADGKTKSTIRELETNGKSGNVTCYFTIGKIFSKSQSFQIKKVVPNDCTAIIVIVVLIQLLLILGGFLVWMIRKKMEQRPQKCKDSLQYKSVAVIDVGLILAIVIEIFAIIHLVFCLKEKQTKAFTVLLAISVTVFIGWLAVGCFLLWKLGKQPKPSETKAEMETLQNVDAQRVTA